jgi:ATP adenylyltransferase
VQVLELRTMPFAAFYVNLHPSSPPSGEQLEAAGAALLARCARHAQHAQGGGEGGPVSYNVLLTCRFLMYVPRGQEGCGPVDCNSLGFAGTMLVRSREELDFVKAMGPTQYLAAVGLPW